MVPTFSYLKVILCFKVNSKPEQYYSEEFLDIIISNVLQNAINYTLEGEIQIVLNKTGFSIIDTGTGIPDEIQQKVFEPFVRAEKVTGDGIGPGLSIVKRVCDKQGWQINIDSFDKGTSINILL